MEPTKADFVVFQLLGNADLTWDLCTIFVTEEIGCIKVTGLPMALFLDSVFETQVNLVANHDRQMEDDGRRPLLTSSELQDIMAKNNSLRHTLGKNNDFCFWKRR